MKPHLRVQDLLLLLQDTSNTMGENTHLVVLVDGKEYPIIGARPYDGVFCQLEIGVEMTDAGTRRDGEFVMVKV